jgi:hypothetical protein
MIGKGAFGENRSIMASASQTQSRRQKRIRLPRSLLSAVSIVLALQLFILPRYVYQISPSAVKLSQFHLDQLDSGLQRCAEFNTPPVKYATPAAGSRDNPRWNPKSGQNETIVLQNATLFDGEEVLEGLFDIGFEKGIITSVSPAGTAPVASGAKS